MLLLQAIEDTIGSLEYWPTLILTILFAFDLHMPFALHQFRTVIAFFYGNALPLTIAHQFFAACSYHPAHFVKHAFSYLYDSW
jgi:hypothetical protein